MFAGKRELTHDEKLRAAYACLINGVHQHHIAALYGVNQGRISEAVKLVEKACGFPPKPAKDAKADEDFLKSVEEKGAF